MPNDLSNEKVYRFLKSLLDPDMYGMAVTAEVRDQVRALLGMKKVETIKPGQEPHALKGYN
jgi:hypothetical protein